ncbi:MAG: tRNA pseudouridine(38-40) synthase TruA [Paraglaciecola sp.]|uniref:tRNA pseudouridine(38-40) synthase TruA n=1 Tax=Paraglaciecola sp. TaxID=1920173 RepID=UPI00273DF45C|nr:tRNA pseudouridine(38-40) synthase TruA [Paraglaciecola sp.]MDP5030247.1 tRNA pseudouridine(38-40) synthase TruA [Paraglaciecola sp.]MDP5133858.1 tRNA pseudouridine(38-40) synthase TruA [Paraglaciecola sp.]
MRIALGVEYDGGAFYGWQRQQTVLTVQQLVEEGLSKIANHPVKVTCAGRTDAGVHATGQVIHFDTDSVRHRSAWTIGINGFLPETISIRWFKVTSDDFHARFSATARRYRYIIHNSTLRSAILARGVTTHFAPLDHELMHEAAQYLVGKQDFSAFRAVNCQANTPVRSVSHITVSRLGDYVMIDVQANAFLHHMVRNITGSLLLIGSGERPVDWLKTLLEEKDRTKAGATAKPNGLYLVDVSYPETFDLPRKPLGPLFLAD